MRFRRFPYNFHDAQLIDFGIGPRHEVSIQVRLDPIWNERQARIVVVRFGAIRNMEAVAEFFGTIARPVDSDRSLDEVAGLAHHSRTKDVVILDLCHTGAIEIHSRNVTVT